MIRVHSTESFGTMDGPGIRLIVFVQGCRFRCLYCQNPDTQDMFGGKEMSPAEIMQRVEKERPYFGGDGGITISGGEPTLQAKNLIPLFKLAQKAGIHTALDTNGEIMNADVEKLYALTDLVILDIKHIDSAEHVKLVGFPNKNPLAMAAYREKTGKPMWLRYVLVPGYNDSEEVVRRWCEAFAAYRTVERVELLPYHTLGVSKYAELGRRYPLEGVEPPSSASIAQARKILEEFFDQVSVH